MRVKIGKKISGFILCFVLVLSISFTAPVNAYCAVTTPMEMIDEDTSMDLYKATVNTNKGKKRTYTIRAQFKNMNFKEKSYLAVHGCAVNGLTVVLTAYSKKYKNYTPKKVYKELEKKVFGKKVWNANYSKPLVKQMPISLYGITKVLKYAGIRTKYVRNFKDATAIKQIENHLKKGHPVIIEVNNHKQKNGKFSKKFTYRWALSKHTMVLIGMTPKGKAIIADSGYREWSGLQQRVKFATVKELVKYMIPCKKSAKNVYFKSVKTDGGYILVNP